MPDRLYKRVAGTGLLLLGLLLLGQQQNSLVFAAWLLLGAGAYLITGAMFAIAFTVFMLSIVHYALGNVMLFGAPRPHWFIGLIIVSGAICLWIKGRAFHQRVKDTREDRWKDRNS